MTILPIVASSYFRPVRDMRLWLAAEQNKAVAAGFPLLARVVHNARRTQKKRLKVPAIGVSHCHQTHGLQAIC